MSASAGATALPEPEPDPDPDPDPAPPVEGDFLQAANAVMSTNVVRIFFMAGDSTTATINAT
jgi:hypothetical protein